MNVLILTPDAVGSTLLQRLITIYMQFYTHDRPVINLHELTNGLVRYQNEHFGQEVLGKKDGKWGYYQSLEQVVDLLSSVDHYKTSRLAHYHIRNRKDSLSDQMQFYQYLNENFYIISCRRHNLFEHALSWCLSKVTKKLNVYTVDEKVESFFDIYKNGIDLDPNSLIQTLNAYKDYLAWCNNHFNVASYFFYEEHLPRIENYILNLPIFARPEKLTWQDNFGMSFDKWNMCHYLRSDIGTLALTQPQQLAQLGNHALTIETSAAHEEYIKQYNKVKDPTWPNIVCIKDVQNLPDNIKQELQFKHGIALPVIESNDIVIKTRLSQPLTNFLPESHQRFLAANEDEYQTALLKIQSMIDNGVLVSPPPIKKQTLVEKKHMIRNYKNLLMVYNQWIEKNPELGNPLPEDVLDKFAEIEINQWNPEKTSMQLHS